MAIVTPHFNYFDAGLPTSKSLPGLHEFVSYQRQPTDPIFLTNVKIVSPQTGFGYLLYDNVGTTTLQSGNYATNPTYYNNHQAYSGADTVTAYYLKYAYQYKAATFGLTSNETLVYLAHEANSNVAETNAAVVAARSYVFDKINKRVTFNQAVSQTQAYEIVQYEQSLAANVDLLPAGQIFSTVLGNTFSLKSDWTLKFTVAPTGSWNVSGGKIEFSFAGGSFTGFVYDSVLYFGDGANGATFTFTDSDVDTVDRAAGSTATGIGFTPVGTTPNPTNLAPTHITVNAVPDTLIINPDVNITGSIRYFDGAGDDQTPNGSGTGDSLSYEYAVVDPIDIEVVEQGYVPVNQQNVTPFDGTLTIQMDFDEAYNASHGLSVTTHYTYDRATKVLNILVDQDAFDVRSSMADTIRTSASYYNTPLLLEAKPGGKRIDLVSGATITSMATWKGAGMERYDAADAVNPVEKWYAVQSVNDITGASVIYRQTSSGSFTVGALTGGVFDEAIQFYADADHDGVPTTNNNSYFVVKARQVGYREARNDVVAGNGGNNLKADLYTIGLAPIAHDYAGNPATDLSLTMTLVAGGTVGGKVFAYKWVDAATNSGTDIADWINYKGATDPNGVIPGGTDLTWAELSDMVIYVTGGVETVRCYKEGSTPTLVGFYVERGGADHPDFVQFQADDGTYYQPALQASISVTGLVNAAGASRNMQILNTSAVNAADWAANTSIAEGEIRLRTIGIGTEYTAGLFFRANNAGTTHATIEPTWNLTPGGTTTDNDITWTCYKALFYDADPAATSYSGNYFDGEEIKAGEGYDIRFAEMNGTTSFKYGRATGIAAASGFSVAMSLETETVYATWAALEGQSGAYFDTTFSPNYILNYIVLDTNTDFSGKSLGLYYCYTLTTSAGMHRLWGACTLVDAGNLRNNDDIADIYLDETAGFVKQTDNIRVFKKNNPNTRPALDPTTGGFGIEVNWKTPVSVVTVATGDAVNQTIVQAALTAQGYTPTRAGKIDQTDDILADTADMQPKVADLHNDEGLDAADPVVLSGDGETSTTKTTSRLTKVITPTGIERTS